MKKILFSLLCLSQITFAQAPSADEGDVLDFSSVKSILKTDMLQEKAQEKKREIIKKKIAKKKRQTGGFYYPLEDDFWTFMSEYWLVKNAQNLKWDFQKPDYGLAFAIEQLFERFGFYEKKFKLLLINSPTVSHFSLPSNPDEYIFILSVPFIRTMDLTKREIAILLLEDYIRSELGYFKNYVLEKDMKRLFGTNFYDKKVDTKILETMKSNYDMFVFKKGYNFKQQFEVTKRMDALLKSDLTFWNSYLVLLKKIDKLIKSNALYSSYNDIYPSPEIQMKWILPKKKVL